MEELNSIEKYLNTHYDLQVKTIKQAQTGVGEIGRAHV